MSVKIFCDKTDCKEEINQNEGGGTLIIVTRQSTLNPTSKQIVPQLRQQEFQICVKHAQEILNYLKEVDPKKK